MLSWNQVLFEKETIPFNPITKQWVTDEKNVSVLNLHFGIVLRALSHLFQQLGMKRTHLEYVITKADDKAGLLKRRHIWANFIKVPVACNLRLVDDKVK